LYLQQIRDDVRRLRSKQLPLVSAMTQNDVLLEWQLPLQLARNCGADERQITYFDAEEQVTSGPDVGKCTSSSTDMLQTVGYGGCLSSSFS